MNSKYIGKIIIGLVIVAAAVILIASCAVNPQDSGMVMGYEDTIFDHNQVTEINIIMEPAQWDSVIANATDESYLPCDVEINGQRVSNVAIRAKGNSSLTTVAMSDSPRHSFKLEFDYYVAGQTFQGLDKLVLNNGFSDATMMKEALTYDMFAWLGADASLYNYAKVSVNGKYFGVYLALEAVEEAFAMRNYGMDYGKLYKPDSLDMNQISDKFGFSFDDMTSVGTEGGMDFNAVFGSFTEEQYESIRQMFVGTDSANAFGFGAEEKPVTALNYIDDSLGSYSDIWDNAVFNSSDADHRRVVAAIRHVNQGTNVEEYLDVDNVLRYLAVHTFVVNLDSATSTMPHNYYLYEENGKLDLIPWDYNLAFGGQDMSGSGGFVNFPIDTPFTGVSLDDRQFFMSLLENETYCEQYHTYLRQLVDGYIYGGRFDLFYTRTRRQIDQLVADDPTAFFSFEEYEAGTEMLCKAVRLRADSITGQLDGTIPSTTSEQAAHPELLLDDSSINTAVMGTMLDDMTMGMDGNGEMEKLNYVLSHIDTLSFEEARAYLGITGEPPSGSGGFTVPSWFSMDMLSYVDTIINAFLMALCFAAMLIALKWVRKRPKYKN